MLEIVHMSEFGARKPAQLSGGQQQRVALARALVNRPTALLLDEPLAALDQKLRHAMQFELKRIQRDTGTTFLLVTHDQQEAMSMSDRMAVMQKGHIEQIGSPAMIYATPASLFVAGFIGTANLLTATITSAGVEWTDVRLADGTGLRARSGGAQLVDRQPVTLMVRPESLRLLPSPPRDRSGIEVTVVDATFQGDHTRLVLRSADGTALHAHGCGDESIGSQLWATWADRDALILGESTDRAGATGTDVDEVEASL